MNFRLISCLKIGKFFFFFPLLKLGSDLYFLVSTISLKDV